MFKKPPPPTLIQKLPKLPTALSKFKKPTPRVLIFCATGVIILGFGIRAFMTRNRHNEGDDDEVPYVPRTHQSSSSSRPESIRSSKSGKSHRSSKDGSRRKHSSKSEAEAPLGHCSLSVKEFGDRIKSCLAVEKYEVQKMTFKVEMDVEFFKDIFDGKCRAITPPVYDERSPVVVADLGGKEAGDIFGSSKMKNGGDKGTALLSKMCVILYPAKKVATVWLSV